MKSWDDVPEGRRLQVRGGRHTGASRSGRHRAASARLEGAAGGIIAGSVLLYAAMFVASLLLGRAWCGWLCGECVDACINHAIRYSFSSGVGQK
jgi:ferredoxin